MGGLQGKTSIKASPYGTCFIVARGLQVGFNELFELTDHGVSLWQVGYGTCEGVLHYSSWDIVSVSFEVRRPGATQSSICRSVTVQVFDGVVGVVVRLVVIFNPLTPNHH